MDFRASTAACSSRASSSVSMPPLASSARVTLVSVWRRMVTEGRKLSPNPIACSRNRSPRASVMVGWASSKGRGGLADSPRNRMASTSSSSLSATGGWVVRRPSPYCTTTDSQPWISMFSASAISNSGCSRP